MSIAEPLKHCADSYRELCTLDEADSAQDLDSFTVVHLAFAVAQAFALEPYDVLDALDLERLQQLDEFVAHAAELAARLGARTGA